MIEKSHLIIAAVLLGLAFVYFRGSSTTETSKPTWKCLVKKSNQGITYICQRISSENFTPLNNSTVKTNVYGTTKSSQLSLPVNSWTGISVKATVPVNTAVPTDSVPPAAVPTASVPPAAVPTAAVPPPAMPTASVPPVAAPAAPPAPAALQLASGPSYIPAPYDATALTQDFAAV